MEFDVPSSTHVLVVGCGPVGATLALMLAQRGISVLVIDKATEIFAAPRAIAFDFDALRILQSADLGNGDFEQVRIPYVRMISPIFGEFARINTSRDVDTHPMQITFYQPELEAVLRKKLMAAETVTTSFGTELLGLTQHETGVTAKVRVGKGTEVDIEAKYLVGADGASSLVRTMIGQDFRGKSFAEDWLIIDAKNPHKPIDHIEFLCDPRRPTPHMVAPGGRQRWEFMLAKGESRQQMEGDAEITRLLAPWGGLSTMDIERRAVYRFHARTAGSFQKGRVFLIGDAAHITPPFVGQGLVSGLRDAANLSWKLAYVVSEKAKADILESYDTERRPHSRAMINIARLMAKLIMPRNRLAAFLCHGTIKLMHLAPKLRGLLQEQGIRPVHRYRHGLFLKPRHKAWPKPGYLLPQIWLVDQDGAEHRSDDVLGQNFALVGFGTDPQQHLNEAAHRVLKDLGASTVHIAGAGAVEPGTAHYRPKTIDPAFPFCGNTVALVRPDRIVLALARPDEVNAMLKAVEQRLMTAAA